MSEVALYRKYRSSDFDAVVGQTEVIQTLKQAVSSGRISHAYLFTGPRGVGKTTVARLLARAINCTGSPKPCNKCDICQVDLNGNLDLIEIDAASNRRIDEIRELRDKINLAPARASYKVYIIDEVHMLTNEAFNALLKTLEEPPAHAVFILATTEFHKLPATIVSRTQRFNFKPISQADTVAQLKKIAGAEKITIADEALVLLAGASDGSLRDAISLMDQLTSFGGSEITGDSVRLLLGWCDPQNIVALSRALATGDTAETLNVLAGLQADGVQADQITSQMVEFWRRLMTATINPALTNDLISPVIELTDLNFIINVIDGLLATKNTATPQLALESALIKLTLNRGGESTVATTESLKTEPTTPAKQEAPKAAKTSKAHTPEVEPNSAEINLSSEQAWQKALYLIKEYNNSLYALIKSCEANFETDQLTLVCRFSFHRQRLEEAKNRTVIERALKAAFGRPIRILVTQNEATSSSPSSASELVTTAIEILGGEVVE